MALFLSELTTPAAAVTSAALADFLGVDATDPLLPGIALAATYAAAAYLQRAITVTQYRAEFDQWPTLGSYNPRDLSRPQQAAKCFLELPMTGPLVSVQSVESAGQTVTDYTMSGGNPSRLRMAATEGPLVVEYTAGWATVPEWAKNAVMQLAAFMYEHRGQCDAQQALDRSGAASMLAPFRVLVS